MNGIQSPCPKVKLISPTQTKCPASLLGQGLGDALHPPIGPHPTPPPHSPKPGRHRVLPPSSSTPQAPALAPSSHLGPCTSLLPGTLAPRTPPTLARYSSHSCLTCMKPSHIPCDPQDQVPRFLSLGSEALLEVAQPHVASPSSDPTEGPTPRTALQPTIHTHKGKVPTLVGFQPYHCNLKRTQAN